MFRTLRRLKIGENIVKEQEVHEIKGKKFIFNVNFIVPNILRDNKIGLPTIIELNDKGMFDSSCRVMHFQSIKNAKDWLVATECF